MIMHPRWNWRPYKNRELECNLPVQVYRNLTKKTWSVRQNELVIAHTDRILLWDVSFYVGRYGRIRVLLEETKNVHAWIEGFIISPSEFKIVHDMLFSHIEDRWERENKCLTTVGVTYDPYKYDNFVWRNTKKPIHRCDFVDMDVDEQESVLAMWENNAS